MMSSEDMNGGDSQNNPPVSGSFHDSVGLSEEERARLEAELWENQPRVTTPYVDRTTLGPSDSPDIRSPKDRKSSKLKGMSFLESNKLAMQQFGHGVTQAMEKVEQKLNKVEKKIEKDIQVYLSDGRSTADYIDHEEIESLKVATMATTNKAFSRSKGKWQLRKKKITYWLMCFEIGFLVGLTEFLNHEGIGQIQNGRIKVARALLASSSSAGIFYAWSAYVLLALVATMFGCALCVYIAPMAKGGGIAEVKAFLNGVKMPELLSLKTGLVKLISTMCSVGAGLAVGQEGPMIHMGSVLAYVCSQMKFKPIPQVRRYFAKFQNARDARDFVASGAAAGVSAAFRSPIGATLFSIEEAASFWSHHLIWRTFFCCMIADWSTNFFIGGNDQGWTKLINNPSTIVYRVAVSGGFKIWEIFCFIGLGVLGGLVGALFISLNMKISGYRKRTYYKQNRNKFIELAIITIITASLGFLGPFAFGCRVVEDDLPNLSNDNSAAAADIEDQIFEPFRCDKATEYNPMASLTFANSEISLKHLYIRKNPKAFGGATLFVFCIFYYMLMAVTSGTWIAAGLLVPQLIFGAAFGRLYGYVLYWMKPEDIDPGIYALLGSSAFMSGVSRLTIALVVIMIEITGDLDALLPIMTVCMVSKWVGDMFNHSIYDEALHAGGIPFLEPDPPKLAHTMDCAMAMVKDVFHVSETPTVEEAYKACLDVSHKTIPVVDTGDDGQRLYYRGSIPRTHLAILLQERAYEKSGVIDVLSTSIKSAPITFTQEELGKKLNLRMYTNVATFTVQEDFPLYLAYKTFRAQGLRDLWVVSKHNELRGVIRRQQLMIHDDEPFGHHGGHGAHGGGHGGAHGGAHGGPTHPVSLRTSSLTSLRSSLSSALGFGPKETTNIPMRSISPQRSPHHSPRPRHAGKEEIEQKPVELEDVDIAEEHKDDHPKH